MVEVNQPTTRPPNPGPPPGLVGVTLLFWGWQTGWLWLGLLIGAILESPWVIRARWDFAQTDLDRIWNLCMVLFFGSLVVAFANNDGVSAFTALMNNRPLASQADTFNKSARAVVQFFLWMPLTLLPIALAQAFSARGRMDWSTFSLWLRRQRQWRQKHATGWESGLQVGWPYFAACLLAASAANERTYRFTTGLWVLVAWALWSRRPRRASPLAWAGCFALALSLGFLTQLGLRELQRMVQRFDAALVAKLGGSGSFSDKENHTMLGEIGRLKSSGTLVLRVETDGQPAPGLLREASYDLFRSPYWVAPKQEFSLLTPETNLTTTFLLPKQPPSQTVIISSYFSRDENLLALPFGAVRVDDLIADLETNALGAVRVTNGPGFARFSVAYQPYRSIDSGVNQEDLEVPLLERPALARLVTDLHLSATQPAEALRTVARHFADHFQYSTWLGPESRPRSNQTAVSRFLLQTRAGHCEYFATATTLLLRQAGIPARYAVGYSVQEKRGDRWLVRARHAHAWCLAWVNGKWLDVDNTPASWAAVEDARASWWERIADLGSDGWYQFSKWRWGKTQWKQYLVWLLLPLLAFAGWRLMSQKQWRRSNAAAAQEDRRGGRPGLDSEFYLIEQQLVRIGLEREPGEPLSAWLGRLAKRGDPRTGPDLHPLLELHYRLRFDPGGLPPDDRARLKEGVAHWMRWVSPPAKVPPAIS